MQVLAGAAQTVIIELRVSPGKVSVDPTKATVLAGGTVAWLVRVEGDLPPLRLTVYFNEATPFTWNVKEIDLLSEQELRKGGTLADVARKPGDYKYGVRAVETETGKTIDDDDPYLTVVEG